MGRPPRTASRSTADCQAAPRSASDTRPGRHLPATSKATMRAPWASAHKQPEAETTPERRVTVILDKRASEIADVLQDALGAGFHVVAFPPADDVIAVLTAASPRLVYAHPQLHLTVGRDRGGRRARRGGRDPRRRRRRLPAGDRPARAGGQARGPQPTPNPDLGSPSIQLRGPRMTSLSDGCRGELPGADCHTHRPVRHPKGPKGRAGYAGFVPVRCRPIRGRNRPVRAAYRSQAGPWTRCR